METEITIKIKEYSTALEMGNKDQELIDAAKMAMQGSYSPYSEFRVGVALLLSDQTIIQGSNQENAAFPSGLCAERVALFYANSKYPKLSVLKMVIVGGNKGDVTVNPITPCGACRQVMLESSNRQKKTFELLLVGQKKIWQIKDANSLLPLAYNGDDL